MTVDEILADPLKALDLSDQCVPTHVVLIVEYAEPGSDNFPGRQRLSYISDDDLPPWTSIGMLRFTSQLELNAITTEDDDEDDEA